MIVIMKKSTSRQANNFIKHRTRECTCIGSFKGDGLDDLAMSLSKFYDKINKINHTSQKSQQTTLEYFTEIV